MPSPHFRSPPRCCRHAIIPRRVPKALLDAAIIRRCRRHCHIRLPAAFATARSPVFFIFHAIDAPFPGGADPFFRSRRRHCRPAAFIAAIDADAMPIALARHICRFGYVEEAAAAASMDYVYACRRRHADARLRYTPPPSLDFRAFFAHRRTSGRRQPPILLAAVPLISLLIFSRLRRRRRRQGATHERAPPPRQVCRTPMFRSAISRRRIRSRCRRHAHAFTPGCCRCTPPRPPAAIFRHAATPHVIAVPATPF